MVTHTVIPVEKEYLFSVFFRSISLPWTWFLSQFIWECTGVWRYAIQRLKIIKSLRVFNFSCGLYFLYSPLSPVAIKVTLLLYLRELGNGNITLRLLSLLRKLVGRNAGSMSVVIVVCILIFFYVKSVE